MNRERLERSAKKRGIPGYMIHGLVSYVVDRRPTGGFLYAVLTNNLQNTYAQADGTNEACVRAYVMFLYNDVPSSCWGSEERVEAWLNSTEGTVVERRGLREVSGE